MNNDNYSNALICGLETLSSDDVKVAAKNIEQLSNFKQILRAIIRGDLVIASPDKIIPETPKQEGDE